MKALGGFADLNSQVESKFIQLLDTLGKSFNEKFDDQGRFIKRTNRIKNYNEKIYDIETNQKERASLDSSIKTHQSQLKKKT